MRMSCNGCRVLRKGCSDSCSIRPCLQWIKNPESQANATVFLAKFYGRAGLLNLINAGPDHLRPAIFRSLLYEACGRMVNPIYGSVGLLWSGSWQLCQAAVEAVLKGDPIVVHIPSETETQTETTTAAFGSGSGYDIRHINNKPEQPAARPSAHHLDLHKVVNKSKRSRTRTRFKRTSATAAAAARVVLAEEEEHEHDEAAAEEEQQETMDEDEMMEFSSSSESMLSGDTSHVIQAEPQLTEANDDHEVGLDLTLGLGLAIRQQSQVMN